MLLRQLLRFLLYVLIAEIAFAADPPAQQPIALQETAANRALLHAEVARVTAIFDLAEWKLERLHSLRSRGHASWQEVAMQQLAVDTASAEVRAAKQNLGQVLILQSHVKASVTKCCTDYEAIRLHLPGSMRLVGWIPAREANADLVRRQRKRLQAQCKILKDVDFEPLESIIDNAKLEVEIYSRIPSDVHQLTRAHAQLRLAVARREFAVASVAKADVLNRRIQLLKLHEDNDAPRGALARTGTVLVDATSHAELSRLTRAMVEGAAISTLPKCMLEQQRASMTKRIDSLRELAKYPQSIPTDLEDAQKELVALEEVLRQEHRLQRVQWQLAGSYSYRLRPVSSRSGRTRERIRSASALLADANVVRYLFDLRHWELGMQSQRDVAVARYKYFAERLARLQRVKATALQPREVEIARDRVHTSEQEIELAETHLSELHRERQRFLCQTAAQCGREYQLVQAADGQLLPRSQLIGPETLLATFGYLGTEPSVATHELAHGYLESALIPGCARDLRFESQSSLVWDTVQGSAHAPTLPLRRTGPRKKREFSRGLMLATDGITYPRDVFCYQPFELWQLYPGHPSVITPNRFRSRLFSYSARYAFGIRRLDGPSPSRIGRATAFGGPWYFPGSPSYVLDQ